MGMSVVDWIKLFQSRGGVQWRIVVTKIMKIRTSQYVKNFVETLANNNVSRRAMVHDVLLVS
jgi:cellobiose-specific phosphotransferase system component IIB